MKCRGESCHGLVGWDLERSLRDLRSRVGRAIRLGSECLAVWKYFM